MPHHTSALLNHTCPACELSHCQYTCLLLYRLQVPKEAYLKWLCQLPVGKAKSLHLLQHEDPTVRNQLQNGSVGSVTLNIQWVFSGPQIYMNTKRTLTLCSFNSDWKSTNGTKHGTIWFCFNNFQSYRPVRVLFGVLWWSPAGPYTSMVVVPQLFRLGSRSKRVGGRNPNYWK